MNRIDVCNIEFNDHDCKTTLSFRIKNLSKHNQFLLLLSFRSLPETEEEAGISSSGSRHDEPNDEFLI